MGDNLDSFLNKHGLKQLPTRGRGDCLFYALKKMLPELLGDTDVRDMRNSVVRHLRNLIDRNVEVTTRTVNDSLVDILNRQFRLKKWIRNHRDYRNWDMYYTKMATQGTYADDPCLWAASSLFGVEITVYVSNRTIQIFSPSWEDTTPSTKISIGNYDQVHYVATAPLDSPGGSGGSGSGASKKDYVPAGSDSGFGLVDSGEGDELVTLLREKQGKKMKKVIEGGQCSLLDMYKEAFPAAPEVSDDDWDDLLRCLGGFFSQFIAYAYIWYNKTKRKNTRKKQRQRVQTIKGYLRSIKNLSGISRQAHAARSLLQVDYSRSPMKWEDYSSYMKLLTSDPLSRRLLSSCAREPREKIIVNSEKRNRLVEAISTAIKIGLNYQMLEKFKVKHVPTGELMTVDDLTYLDIELDHDVQEGKIQAAEDGLIKDGFEKLGIKGVLSFKEAELKKVSMTVLNEHPYWEGISVQPDLGTYISSWKLENVRSPKYINTTKRETLTKIYETFGSYDVNFDKTTPEKLEKMCGLKTLKLAPGVHKAICEEGNIEEAFRVWQASDRSYKVLRDDVTSEGGPYIVPSKIEAVQDPSNPNVVEQVLGENFINLARIIQYTNQDNHEAELKSEPLELSDAPVDADFAQKLSEAFVELGFLPEGYPQYCGVKVGEDGGKRQLDGADPAAKRQRRKLFTAIEIH